MPLPPFSILRDDEPIHIVPLRNTVRTGIASGDVRLEFEMVSEYEEREAAVFAGIPWIEWMTIDTRERAACVAHYRLHGLTQLHSQDAVARAEEQRRKREQMKAAQQHGA